MSKVLEILCEKVVAQLDKGIIPWRREWRSLAPANINGREYNGINFFLLSMFSYETPVFMTFNQMVKAGGKLKDDAKGKSLPVFYWLFERTLKDKRGKIIRDANGKAKKTKLNFPIPLYYNVWNIEHIEGVELPKRFTKAREPVPTLEVCESVVKGYATCPPISHGGSQAYYTPVLDKIQMPARNDFTNADAYYLTLFHEMTHSTGHANRLNRKEVQAAEYDTHCERYSVEELVAEMGAALLAAHCGLNNSLDNSAAYIAGWRKKMKDDPKVLMTAAGRASKAAEYILGTAPADKDEETEE